jgi:hypothetical protein
MTGWDEERGGAVLQKWAEHGRYSAMENTKKGVTITRNALI